jgi:SAM-dependent methyltransferase
MKRLFKKLISPFRRFTYLILKGKPWSYGYLDARWFLIYKSIRSQNVLDKFKKDETPSEFAIGFDERTVEYPWIFSKIAGCGNKTVLDAGSTFNYSEIISHPLLAKSNLNIFTFYPEEFNFIKNRVSYQFGDLRELPYKDNFFDLVICQSTIEHIDMDNSIYGYELEKHNNPNIKSYEYLKVINELARVLKSKGKLLLTFPYGKFENHGFFQQFDEEMVSKICHIFNELGEPSTSYIQYQSTGWKFSNAEFCKGSTSYNPHTGVGKGADGAAHSRAICCIEFNKF